MNRMSMIVASWIGTLVLTGCGTVGRDSQEGGHGEAGGSGIPNEFDVLGCPDVSTPPIVAHRSATPIFEQASGITRLFTAGGRTFGARYIDGPDEDVAADQGVLEELDLDQGLATAVGAPFDQRSIVSVVQHSQGLFAYLSPLTSSLQSQILRIDGASVDVVTELNSENYEMVPLAVTTAALIAPDNDADGTQRIEPSGAIEALDRDARLIVGDGDRLLWLIPVFAEEMDCNQEGCVKVARRYELLRTDDRGKDAVVLRDDLCVHRVDWAHTGEYYFFQHAGADGRLVVSTGRAVFSMLPDGSDQRFIAGVRTRQLVVDGDTAWIGFKSGDYDDEEFVVWRAPILGGDVEEIYRAKVRPNPDDSGSWRRFSLGTVSGSYVVVVDLANGGSTPARLWRITMDE
jgi:hypothetical protein